MLLVGGTGVYTHRPAMINGRLQHLTGHLVSGGVATKVSTNHPANQPLGLGRTRRLRVLTEQQLSLFWENGFLVVEDLLSPVEVAALADRTDAIASAVALLAGNVAKCSQQRFLMDYSLTKLCS